MDEDDSEITQFFVKAALTNLDHRLYTTARFLVPSEQPAGSISSYITIFDRVYHLYRVISRVLRPSGFPKFSIPVFDVAPSVETPKELNPLTTS